MKDSRQWSVYIVGCSDRSLYTGISINVPRRIQQHNSGKGAAYTRSRKPVILLWYKKMATESAARKLEAEIKSWPKQHKQAFIQLHNSSV